MALFPKYQSIKGERMTIVTEKQNRQSGQGQAIKSCQDLEAITAVCNEKYRVTDTTAQKLDTARIYRNTFWAALTGVVLQFPIEYSALMGGVGYGLTAYDEKVNGRKMDLGKVCGATILGNVIGQWYDGFTGGYIGAGIGAMGMQIYELARTYKK